MGSEVGFLSIVDSGPVRCGETEAEPRLSSLITIGYFTLIY